MEPGRSYRNIRRALYDQRLSKACYQSTKAKKCVLRRNLPKPKWAFLVHEAYAVKAQYERRLRQGSARVPLHIDWLAGVIQHKPPKLFQNSILIAFFPERAPDVRQDYSPWPTNLLSPSERGRRKSLECNVWAYKQYWCWQEHWVHSNS